MKVYFFYFLLLFFYRYLFFTSISLYCTFVKESGSESTSSWPIIKAKQKTLHNWWIKQHFKHIICNRKWVTHRYSLTKANITKESTYYVKSRKLIQRNRFWTFQTLASLIKKSFLQEWRKHAIFNFWIHPPPPPPPSKKKIKAPFNNHVITVSIQISQVCFREEGGLGSFGKHFAQTVVLAKV